MSGVFSASNSSTVFSSCIKQPETLQSRAFVFRLRSAVDNPRTRLCLSDAHSKFRGLRGSETAQRRTFRCNSSSDRPGAPGSGENDSKTVLDAFFLGKALAEVINERLESTVGEVLGAIGRLQAEQQKQVQEIQEQVLERAKRAKEKAAREAVEAQGLVPKDPTASSASVCNGVSSAGLASTGNNAVTYANPSSSYEPSSNVAERKLDPTDRSSVLGVPDDN